MCVAAIAWRAHPHWPVVVIGNRDEFHDRPAAPLDRWDNNASIMAGRDMRSGGTWLGVSDHGRLALVTNRRGFGEPDPALESRGRLMADLLSGSGEHGDPRSVETGRFNPFNVIAILGDEAQFIANRPDHTHSILGHGIYGLSNGSLDEPWPKTLQLKAALLDWLNAPGHNTADLFAPLACEVHPDIGIHPDEPSEITQEARDTAPFIRHPIYGTRCSTVIAIDAAGHGTIAERRFSAAGDETGRTTLQFVWP
jgi:uncharacterized protein with NRDE domain